MVSLTTRQQKLLNGLTRVHDSSVKLGDIIQAMILAGGTNGTPVNAVNATASVTLTGVVVHGEKLTVGPDVFEFVANGVKSSPSNILVDIHDYVTQASTTLTMDTQPTPGDTITIGAKTYIFVPVGTANHEGEISIGADLAEAQLNLIDALLGIDGVNTKNSAIDVLTPFAANATTVKAAIGGVAGNAIVTTETFTASTNVFAAAHLTSGADCTAANAITALATALASGTGAFDNSKTVIEGTTVTLTATTAGVIGNNIPISETLANATIANSATKFAGGVDGTVAAGMAIMADDSYLYICPNGNTKAQANWKRIALTEISA